MLRYFSLSALALLCGAGGPFAAELKILPADIPLSGPHAGQRLLVVREDGGKVLADLTGKAKVSSSNLAVAKVDEEGTVHAVGDGEAVLTATDGSGNTPAAAVFTVNWGDGQVQSFSGPGAK